MGDIVKDIPLNKGGGGGGRVLVHSQCVIIAKQWQEVHIPNACIIMFL